MGFLRRIWFMCNCGTMIHSLRTISLVKPRSAWATSSKKRPSTSGSTYTTRENLRVRFISVAGRVPEALVPKKKLTRLQLLVDLTVVPTKKERRAIAQVAVRLAVTKSVMQFVLPLRPEVMS
jgi:hypothetical protein